VHLLGAAETVEEAMLELQERKRVLAAASLGGARPRAADIARYRLDDMRLLCGTAAAATRPSSLGGGGRGDGGGGNGARIGPAVASTQ
jgi:uncharacterized membrane protein